jgi:hypothetical protein
MASRPLREGIIAGLIGATSVAIWFLIVDLIAGHPLETPATLGAGLMSVLGPERGDSLATQVIFYTIFHYVAFMVIGIIVAALLGLSERQPSVLAGMLILFVAFELGFYGIVTLLAHSSMPAGMAWYQIGAANIVAALVMGLYLRRAHPHAGERLREVLAGGE